MRCLELSRRRITLCNCRKEVIEDLLRKSDIKLERALDMYGMATRFKNIIQASYYSGVVDTLYEEVAFLRGCLNES